MDSICEGDERSSSERSFPSLDFMHYREQEDIEYGTTTVTNEIDGIKSNISILDACGMENPTVGDNPYDSHDDEDDDGYPTDEQTMGGFPRPKEKERKRLNILQLARRRVATKKTTEIHGQKSDVDDFDIVANVDTENIVKEYALTFDGEKDVDDSSFLANVDVEDAEITQPPKDSDREQYVFGFSFLTTNNGEVVEEQPDDSSFIVGAGVEDVPGDFQSIGQSRDGTAVDSCYDVHASTLSKASASTRISIGDMILKESNMAAQLVRNDGDINRNLDANTLGEDQSASTYSYMRAYVDTVTLASNYTSTLSALTDDYLFHARRTGMSEPIKPNPIQEGPSFESGETSQDSQPSRGGEINRSHIIPVDADSGALISQSDNSIEGSLSRPPPQCLSVQATDFLTYENSAQLTNTSSFGRGNGYVDEEAAHKFATPVCPNFANRCYSWLTSSSRPVKICIICSIVLLLMSVASVALALLLPEKNVISKSSINDRCASGAPCSKEGMRCNDRTTESCCGETYYSFVCDCVNDDGKLWYMCIHTDVCFDPSCESLNPVMSNNSPTTYFPTLPPSKPPQSQSLYTALPPTYIPTGRVTYFYTALPTTDTPTVGVTYSPTSKASTFTQSGAPGSSVPESTIYTESPITDTPTEALISSPFSTDASFTLSKVPGSLSTESPITDIPPVLLTYSPTSNSASFIPSKVPESPIYTELPITNTPSVLLTYSPTATFHPSGATESTNYTILPPTNIPTDQLSAVFSTQQPTQKVNSVYLILYDFILI